MVALSVKLIRNHGSASPVSETHILSFVVLSPSVSADGPKSSRYWLLTVATSPDKRFVTLPTTSSVAGSTAVVSFLVVEVTVVVPATVPVAGSSQKNPREAHKVGQFSRTCGCLGDVQYGRSASFLHVFAYCGSCGGCITHAAAAVIVAPALVAVTGVDMRVD
jgi:hypothetical protein